MPNIVKQISMVGEGQKNVYPTGVLGRLCSIAFEHDHALVQHHLCNVASAFCNRSKVRFCSKLRQLLVLSLLLMGMLVRVRLMQRQVSTPASEKKLKEIWNAFTLASATPCLPLCPFIAPTDACLLFRPASALCRLYKRNLWSPARCAALKMNLR